MAKIKHNHLDEPPIQPARFNSRFSLGVRFIIVMILATLLTGTISTYVAISLSQDSIREESLSNNFAQAKLSSSFISEYMTTIQTNIRAFAARPDIRKAVIDNTPEQLQGALAEFIHVQASLETSAIFDTNGIQRVNSMADAPTVGQSFADRSWFQEIMTTSQPVQSAPLTSRLTGSPSVPYSVPILDEQGIVRGMVNGVITLSQLSETIIHNSYTNDTRVSIVYLQDGGVILAHIDHERIMTPVSGENEAVTRLIAGGNGAIETTSSDGEENFIGFSQVPGLPWGVLVITPSATAMALIDTMTQSAVISNGLIILAISSLGIITVYNVIRPLRRLTEGIAEIGKGNLSYQISTTRNDEIGVLSHAISNMAQELKHTLVSRDKLEREILERKNVELALKENETRLQSLFNNMAEGVALHELVFDETGNPTNYRVIDVNAQFEEILGVNRSSVIGNLATTAYGTADPPFLDVYATVALSLTSTRIEVPFEPLGRLFEISIVPWGQRGFATLFTDITERSRIWETTSKLASIVEFSAEALIGRDINGIITSWNKSAERIFGYTAAEMIGQSNSALIPSNLPNEVPDILEKIRESGISIDWETTRKRKDGTIIDVAVTISPIKDTKGSVTGYSTIARDITEANKANDRIKAALAEKELLLKEIHHRVKNNMQVVSSLLKMQSQFVNDESTRAMLKETQERIKSMSLVYNKLYQSADIASIDIKDYVNELVTNLLHAYVPAPGLIRTKIEVAEVSFDLDTAIPLGLIINELVTNAIKYAFPDNMDGTIQVSLQPLNDNGKYTLIIKDDGVGLPEDFDPLNNRSLGMRLVNALAKHQLGGIFDLERSNGTTFRIVFQKE
ncbi:MAG: PAS domain S-box protein [Dehalogenimonas sp.]